MRYTNGRRLPYSLTIIAALAMAACGGSSSDDTDGGDGGGGGGGGGSGASITLSGEVARLGTLKNVIVCLDLNGNDACDSGEPASSATGADGKYSLSTTASQAAAARLIAPVKTGDPAAATTAIDSHNPAVAATDADYVLTGVWSHKAYDEAARLGRPRVAASSEATGHDRIPDALDLRDVRDEEAELHLHLIRLKKV